MQLDGGGLSVLAETSATSVAMYSPAKPSNYLDVETCLGFSRFWLGGDGIIHLYACAITKRTQHLVAAGDNVFALLQTAFYFNVRRACESGLQLTELDFLAGEDDKYSLHFFLLFVRSGRHRLRLTALFPGVILCGQFSLVANGECLNRDGESIGARATGNFCRS